MEEPQSAPTMTLEVSFYDYDDAVEEEICLKGNFIFQVVNNTITVKKEKTPKRTAVGAEPDTPKDILKKNMFKVKQINDEETDDESSSSIDVVAAYSAINVSDQRCLPCSCSGETNETEVQEHLPDHYYGEPNEMEVRKCLLCPCYVKIEKIKNIPEGKTKHDGIYEMDKRFENGNETGSDNGTIYKEIPSDLWNEKVDQQSEIETSKSGQSEQKRGEDKKNESKKENEELDKIADSQKARGILVPRHNDSTKEAEQIGEISSKKSDSLTTPVKVSSSPIQFLKRSFGFIHKPPPESAPETPNTPNGLGETAASPAPRQPLESPYGYSTLPPPSTALETPNQVITDRKPKAVTFSPELETNDQARTENTQQLPQTDSLPTFTIERDELHDTPQKQITSGLGEPTASSTPRHSLDSPHRYITLPPPSTPTVTSNQVRGRGSMLSLTPTWRSSTTPQRATELSNEFEDHKFIEDRVLLDLIQEIYALHKLNRGRSSRQEPTTQSPSRNQMDDLEDQRMEELVKYADEVLQRRMRIPNLNSTKTNESNPQDRNGNTSRDQDEQQPNLSGAAFPDPQNKTFKRRSNWMAVTKDFIRDSVNNLKVKFSFLDSFVNTHQILPTSQSPLQSTLLPSYIFFTNGFRSMINICSHINEFTFSIFQIIDVF